VTGVGIDLLEVDRLEQALERRPRLAERLFTDGEREYASTRARPVMHLAARFCAKEAVAKALGLGLVGGPRALVAEHLDAESGTVRMRLSGEMAARLPAVNGRTLIAHTSRDSDLVVATSLYTTE
jgi:holo-[acyl-carrier protein] synthase